MEIENHHHYKVYKPYGFISQFITNDSKAKNKKFLGELYDFPEGIMAIGRLDEKSEGLLLLTTNGKLSYLINSRKVEKEYYAQLDGEISTEAINQLQQGVDIGLNGKTYSTKPCIVSKIDKPNFPERGKKIRDERLGPTSWVSITIKEGKFRQVRKITAVVGFPTLRLVRVRVGEIYLLAMVPGEVVPIKDFKI